MKKVFLTLVGIMAAGILGGCGKEAAPDTASNENVSENADYKVALVTGIGGLGDESFNDSLYEGIKQAQSTLGITYQLVEPQEYAELADDFNELALDGKYDLIIGCGYEAVEGIEAAAKEYPEQKFILVDGDLEGYDNLQSVYFRDNEKTFLVGMMAAMQTQTGKIGMVAATDTPDQHVFVAGYMAGAQYVNPDIDISVKYTGSFEDTATAKELAIALSEGGVDVIYAAAGGAGLGVYSSADEYHFWSIGTDTNLCPDYPESMVISAYRDMANVVEMQVRNAVDGNFKGGKVSVGLVEEALGITNEGSNVETNDSFWEEIDKAKGAIMSGEIEVPSSLE